MIKLLIVILTTAFLSSNKAAQDQVENVSRDHITYCEQRALSVGSKLADAYNAPISNEEADQRLHQDYLSENLGFAPWMSGGTWRSGGLTLTKSSAKALQEKGGWKGQSLKDSPYQTLRGKWIYFYGDSTIRQIWVAYAAPFQDNKFERNAKEWTRHYVSKQIHCAALYALLCRAYKIYFSHSLTYP